MSAKFVIYWKSSLTGHIGNGEPVSLAEAQDWVSFYKRETSSTKDWDYWIVFAGSNPDSFNYSG